MGLYSGLFTTPDLLWSAFPVHTPYHYAYNSPLTYRDPSGLAPVKEKEGEELKAEKLPCTGPCDDNKEDLSGEIDNGAVAGSPQPESSNGSRTAEESSAPDDLGEGGGNGGFSLDINFSDFGSSDPGHTGSGSMFESVGLLNSGPPNMGQWKDDETPWCGSFLNWVFLQIGIQGPSNSARALNWKNFGQILGNTSNELIQGATVVVKTTNGHHVTTCVGIVEGEKSFWGLGGNQGSTSTNNGVRVQVSKYKFSNIISINYPTGYYPWPYINISPNKPFFGR